MMILVSLSFMIFWYPDWAEILHSVNLHFAVRQINSMASLHSASMILILFCFQIYFIWEDIGFIHKSAHQTQSKTIKAFEYLRCASNQQNQNQN